MRNIIEYEILRGSADEVDQVVNTMIKEGWQPFGAPAVVNTSGCTNEPGLYVFQAMVKYEGECL